MEVYDFLYNFLLPKLLPLKKIHSWTEETSEIRSYGYTPDMGGEEDFDGWCYFLLHCRLFLQPLDLVNLFTLQSWRSHTSERRAEYFRDMELYMLERGASDDEQARGVSEWQIGWERQLLSDRWDWACFFEDVDLLREYTAPEKDQWLARVRGNSGSPFHRDFHLNAQHAI